MTTTNVNARKVTSSKTNNVCHVQSLFLVVQIAMVREINASVAKFSISFLIRQPRHATANKVTLSKINSVCYVLLRLRVA